ncbi:hypothetical protein D3C74_142860 [compost metagenome]
MFNLFGNKETLSKKKVLGEKNRDLYRLLAFDESIFEQKLGFKLLQYNEFTLKNIAGFLQGGELVQRRKEDFTLHYFKNSLSICLRCLKDGYHSILHQFEFITHCPFHNSSLLSNCPSCNLSIPYALSDSPFEQPYTCKCGYIFKLIKNNCALSSHWGKYTTSDIKDPQVLNWVNMSEQEHSKLNNVYIYPYTQPSKTAPLILDVLLRIVNREDYIGDTNYTYSSHKSSSYIQYLKSPIDKNRFTEIHSSKWKPIKYALHEGYDNSSIIKEFIKTKFCIINALSNYYKKTILKEHTTCIHRYVNISRFIDQENTPVCPYAEAYVRWKEVLLRLDNFYDVDNLPTNIKSHIKLSSLSLVHLDNDPLTSLINECIKKSPIENHEYHAHYNWLISHITWHVINQLFFSFLKDQTSRISLEERIIFDRTFLAFRMPTDKKEPFEVYWSSLAEKHDTEILECPFSTVNLRRKSNKEKSFHPMKIAMENNNKSMKTLRQ